MENDVAEIKDQICAFEKIAKDMNTLALQHKSMSENAANRASIATMRVRELNKLLKGE